MSRRLVKFLALGVELVTCCLMRTSAAVRLLLALEGSESEADVLSCECCGAFKSSLRSFSFIEDDSAVPPAAK